MTTEHGSDLGTPAEVADYLRTTQQQLARMRYRGTGPHFVKLGSRVLYRWTDVQAYIDEHTRTSTINGA